VPPPIGVSARPRGDGRVTIKVSDHGPGIPVERLDEIFEPYARLVDDRTMSQPGIGLGLPLAGRLAEGQGGTLRYLPGSGATFELSLPSSSVASGESGALAATA
jgi:signal transduction histidine kinase